MKLSDLIRYRNTINELSVSNIWTKVQPELSAIDHEINANSIQVENFAEQIHTGTSNIQKYFAQSQEILDNLNIKLNELISDTARPWFQESYRLFEQEMCFETAEYILNRRPPISTDSETFYRTRLIRYANWQYPAMVIRPGLETFINELVACDPMYLVDIKHDLLTPALNAFNEQYSRRLRPYIIDDREDTPILEQLPKNQFGLIFAYNYFNYKPFEILKRYFIEMLECLRPGGVLAMTFNDCDRPHGVMLVEQHFCCYTPGYLIIELAQSLGYELIFKWHDGGPSTWIELRKPGNFETLRGGQSLAKIIPKSIAESK